MGDKLPRGQYWCYKIKPIFEIGMLGVLNLGIKLCDMHIGVFNIGDTNTNFGDTNKASATSVPISAT